MKQKNTPAQNTKQGHQKTKFYSTNVNAQQQRLLKALENAGPDGITTIQARHELDILHPAGRVCELRHDHGKNIQTIWTVETNPNGGEHRVARFVLLPGKYKAVA